MDLDDVFNMPLEVLGLPAIAMKVLLWDDIISIGDCLLFYARDARNRASVLPLTHLCLYSEVFEALVTQGYWRFMEETRISDWLGRRVSWRGRRIHITLWHVRGHDFYQMRLEALGLSVRGNNALRGLGLSSIGDCLRFYWATKDGAKTMHDTTFVFNELEANLYELGYMEYVEDSDSLA